MRIWINRAARSRTHLIDMLRNNPEGESVSIHATMPGATGPALAAADTFGDEPNWGVSDAEYVDWALAQVRAFGIQVMLPTARMTALAAYERDFARSGCALVTAADERAAVITASKTLTYQAAEQAGVLVPPYFRIASAAELRDAAFELRRRGYVPCVKPDIGWSAGGFRILVDAAPTLTDLLAEPSPTVHLEDYTQAMLRAAHAGHTIEPMIVTPVLDEPETSVDCLRLPDGGVLSVGRAKDEWARSFVTDPDGIAEAMVKALDLKYLSNVQTRMLDGRPVLLEVNARPSAGVYQTMATGVNLVWAAVASAALGHPGLLGTPKLGGVVVTGDTVLAA